MIPHVDLVVLTRHDGPLHPEVERGFREQCAVDLVVHRIVGSGRSEDRCRWDAIARARNEGKLRGSCTLADVSGRRCRPRSAVHIDAGERTRLGDQPTLPWRPTIWVKAGKVQSPATCRWAPHSSGGGCSSNCTSPGVTRSANVNAVATICGDCTGASITVAPHSHDIFPKPRSAKAPLQSEYLGDNSTVTCMCVTRNRVRLLRRSVQCFLSQTYCDRELVVVYQSDDEPTRQFLADLGESSIHPVEVPAVPRLSLGSLRNIARQAGTGKYVATWDDDDWHGPHRLAEQVRSDSRNRQGGMPVGSVEPL